MDKNPFSDPPYIMGIVNVTPDSFSDGGKFSNPHTAIAHAQKLIDEGADIIDIGGESTRPGARPVSAQEEMDRVIPVIEGLKGCDALISIDTRYPQTMTESVRAGAGMINDVSALTGSDSLATAARLDVPVCLMHMKGDPQTMQNNPIYRDVSKEVFGFLQERIEACIAAGIRKEFLIADPGIGFGKGLQHNLILLRDVSKLQDLGVPILVGLSRKSFIANIAGDSVTRDDPAQRLPGSVAASLWCLQQGVQIFRTHDVAQTRQAFDVYEAILRTA
jgi:dihydropteroate synthase